MAMRVTKTTGLALVAALLCGATVPAKADDEGPAATACMMQQIGFRAAAPCMIKYMKTLGNAPNMQLAAQTAALEEQVRAGRISNRDAYTRYVAIRNEVHSAQIRANIGAALGAFATGFAAGMPRTTTCNRIGASVQCQTW
jgi:hypothetical protein